MTDQEAIQRLKDFGYAFQMLDLEEGVIYLSIKALGKQVPQRPSYIDEDANYFECPVCGGAIYSSDSLSTHKYCLECGQAIDWSEEVSGYVEKAFTLYMKGLDGDDTADLIKEIKEKMTEEERKEFEEIVKFHQLVMEAL